MTSGFVKNIAGQVRDRRRLVFAKGVSLFVYTVLTMLIFTGIQTVSNALFFDEFVFGPVKDYKHIHTETNTQHHTDDIVAKYDRNAHHDHQKRKM